MNSGPRLLSSTHDVQRNKNNGYNVPTYGQPRQLPQAAHRPDCCHCVNRLRLAVSATIRKTLELSRGLLSYHKVDLNVG